MSVRFAGRLLECGGGGDCLAKVSLLSRGAGILQIGGQLREREGALRLLLLILMCARAALGQITFNTAVCSFKAIHLLYMRPPSDTNKIRPSTRKCMLADRPSRNLHLIQSRAHCVNRRNQFELGGHFSFQ
jgi:hypothetical protein